MKTAYKMLGLVFAGGLLVTACGDEKVDPPVDTTSLGACAAASNWEVWVPRQMTNDIRIVNGPQFAVTDKTIDLSMTGLTAPHGVTFNKDGTRAVVAMLGATMAPFNGGVVIIDTANYSVVGQVVTNQRTHQAVFAPNGEIWAINVNGPGTVSFIDATAQTVSGTLEVGGQAVAIRFLADGSKGFLTNQAVENEKSKVHVVNVASKSIEGDPYITGKTTVTPILDKDNKFLYTTSGMDNLVNKIDLSAADRATAVSTFATDIAEAHAIALAEKHVIVTARMGGRVSIFNADGSVAKHIPITVAMGNPIPDMVALSPDCKKAYVTERAEGKLLQIDMDTQEITSTLDLGGGYTHGVSIRKLANPDM